MSDAQPVLRVVGLTKRFGELVANDAISLELGRGEVLALLGENGAGKSTLVSMLFGHYVPDGGSIELFGAPLPPGDTRVALAAGVGMVHQHFTLADNLSVLDNVLVGQEPLWRLSSARAAMRATLLQAAADYGLAVDPDAPVAELSVGERQRVEILKALVRGAKILILDEPTAVLTPQESEQLFATLARFVAGGLSIIFISHKLDEVLRVSDRVVVLRAGKLVAQADAASASAASLARAMVGRELTMPHRAREDGVADASQADGAPEEVSDGGEAIRPAANARAPRRCAPPAMLDLQAVTVVDGTRALLREVSLSVRAGEIVAIAGVAGNGQQALADVVCGLRAPATGRVTVGGEALPTRPRAWIDAGVARIPEDRVATGAIGDATLAENAIVGRHRDPGALRGGWIGRWLGVLDRGGMRAAAQGIVERFDVRHGSLDQPIRMLSGGNIQKFILGRELAREPRLIVANQPTWGLDVGAVAYVHGQLLDARHRGAAILLISEELEEIFALADRIAVIYQGRLAEARPAADWDAERIGLAMAGQGVAASAAA